MREGETYIPRVDVLGGQQGIPKVAAKESITEELLALKNEFFVFNKQIAEAVSQISQLNERLTTLERRVG